MMKVNELMELIDRHRLDGVVVSCLAGLALQRQDTSRL